MSRVLFLDETVPESDLILFFCFVSIVTDKLRGTAADIFTRGGKHEHVTQMMKERDISIVESNILMKSYGKIGNPVGADQYLRELLQNPDAEPDIVSFNMAINAYADSSLVDAFDKACDLMRLLESDPRCLSLGLRPNAVTFACLVKCAATSKYQSAGEQAEAILNEREWQYLAGEIDLKPDVVVYTSAILTCFNAGDVNRANTLLARMHA